MTKKKTAKKTSKQKNIKPGAFMANPFDPLGMYGAVPSLPVLEDEAPTQDSDDL